MEPFSPNDPLHQLLGKSRPVKVRTDFTQNVLRAIRQEPQREGLWLRLQDWLAAAPFRPGHALAAAAILLFAGVGIFVSQPESGNGQADVVQTAPVSIPLAPDAAAPSPQDETSLESVVASDLDSMDQLSVLLAQQDTSALTDSEIAVLLY